MKVINKISSSITNSMIENLPNITPEKAEQIEHVLKGLMSDGYKNLIVMIIAALIGVFKYSVLVLTIIVLLRLYLGGTHAKTPIKCLFIHVPSVLFIVYLSLSIRIDYLSVFVYPVIFIIAYLYAPSDVPTKPIVSEKMRKRLRKKGIICLAILMIMSLILPFPWSNLITISSLYMASLVTPIMYRLTGNTRSNLSIGGEKSC